MNAPQALIKDYSIWMGATINAKQNRNIPRNTPIKQTAGIRLLNNGFNIL